MTKESRYELIFNEIFGARTTPSEDYNYIEIISSGNAWNNFGYKCLARFIVNQKDRNPVSFSGHGAFIRSDPPAKGIPDSYDLSDPKALRKNHPKETLIFFSLLQEMNEYRRLVQEFGEKETRNILSSLNDLALLRSDQKLHDNYNQFIRTPEFRVSFLRESASFFAYHNGASIIDGRKKESLNSITKKYRINFHLDGFENPHDLHLNFSKNGAIPRNINILIGKNGLGKSQTLHKIVETISNPRTDHKDRAIVSKILAIGTPGETENTFPEPQPGGKIEYKRVSLFSPNDRETLGELCAQLARDETEIAGQWRWLIFIDALDNGLDADTLYLELDSTPSVNARVTKTPNGKSYVHLKDLRSQGEQARLEIFSAISRAQKVVRIGRTGNVFPSSSGETAFINFLLQTCTFIENGTLLLIDEPETHLHPNLITKFFSTLNNLLESTGSLAIIATHSPYFVREVAADQVNVYLQRGENRIDILKPRLKTIGADLNSISQFIFQDEEEETLIESRIDDLVKNDMLDTNTLEELKNNLSSKALILLQRKIRKNETP